MKKTVSLIAGCIWTALLFSSAYAAQGVIVSTTESECSDYFIVDTGSGFVLLEWYGGHVPSKDDKVVGEFDRYSFEEISVLPDGDKMRVWVEDYDLTEDDAADKLREKCG
jgi:hypothetical protein